MSELDYEIHLSEEEILRIEEEAELLAIFLEEIEGE